MALAYTMQFYPGQDETAVEWSYKGEFVLEFHRGFLSKPVVRCNSPPPRDALYNLGNL